MPKSSAFERLSHPFTKNRQPFELLSHIRSQIIFIRPTAVHVVRRWMACTFTNGSSAALVSLSAFKRHKQINPTVRINSLNIRSFLYTGWKGKYIKPRPHVSGYFRIRILFFPDTPFVHTHPVNPTCESGNFWIRSPEWKLLNPILFRISVDGRIRWRCKIGSSLYSRLHRVATKQHGSQPKRFCCSHWAE